MTARRKSRRTVTRRKSQSSATLPSEHVEQTKFVARVRLYYPDVILAAVPNGARLKGGARAGSKLKDEGLLPGYPDLLIDEARGGYFGLRIEMKRVRGGRLSKDQREAIARLLERGYSVFVCCGVEEAWPTFEQYMAQPPTQTVRPQRTVVIVGSDTNPVEE